MIETQYAYPRSPNSARITALTRESTIPQNRQFNANPHINSRLSSCDVDRISYNSSSSLVYNHLSSIPNESRSGTFETSNDGLAVRVFSVWSVIISRRLRH